MTFASQLRAMADRLEELDRQRFAVTEELLLLVGDRFAILDGWDVPADSASVLVADEREAVGAGSVEDPAPPSAPIDRAGAVRVKRTPAHQAGNAGSTPAPRSTAQAEDSQRSAVERSTPVHCPDCEWVGKQSGLGVHRRHRHGYRAGDVGDSRGPINCPDCGESIAQKKNLARHRKAAHGIEPWRPTPEVPSNGPAVIRKGAEWFVCARCDLKFPTRDARDRHQVTHPPIPAAPPLRSIGGGGA